MSFGPAPAFPLFSEEKYRSFMEAMRDKVAPILANNLLPHFTDHSVTHSDNVAQVIDKLVEGLKQPLSNKECMILYGACYLHDIGMQFERADETEVIQGLSLNPRWDQLSVPEKRNLLRKFHNKISAEMVQKSVGSANPPIGFQLTSEFEGSYIARLCDAHCVPADSNEYRELVKEGPDIRMPLLSALLRIGDILDESRRRATKEKARTLSLDLFSQSHWWRHYFTEDVTFLPAKRQIQIWFDFPSERLEEYKQIVPALQVPWVEAELNHHNHVLLAEGCQWSLIHTSVAKPYSDATEMPEEVLAEMLKQLYRARQKEEALRDTLKLAQFREAQPSIDRRLEAIRAKKESMGNGEFIVALAKIADDMHELGGHAIARSTIRHAFTNGLQDLLPEVRIALGTKLLKRELDSGYEDSSGELLKKMQSDFESIEASDPRKMDFAKLRIQVFDMLCAYPEAKAAIAEAMDWATSEDKVWLDAELSRMKLLQGDFVEGSGADA